MKETGVRTVTLTTTVVLGIIYVVPFLVYALFSRVVDFQPPGDTPPGVFLLSIFVSKLGTALAFVSIFSIGRETVSERWHMYALSWWILFVVDEFGQAMRSDYTWPMAIAGIISETIYVPLAAYVTNRMLAGK